MRTNNIRRAPQLWIAGLALAGLLAACGAPGAATPTTPPQQDSTPAAQPTAAAPTSAPEPTAAPSPAQPTSAPEPTAAPQPTTAPAPTSAASQPADSATAAVQTVLDYYAAISDKKFADAYAKWANNGAASGQTLAQFEQGFANTAGVRLRLGTPKPGAPGAIDVPVLLISISNDPNPQQPQHVQQFQGSYSVAPGADGMRLASAAITETANPALPPAEWSDPDKLLQGYYDLINRRELAAAYTYWANNGASSTQSFAQFAQGYAATRQVAIELGAGQAGGAAGSIYDDIPALIVATQADGSQQAFCGTYTLRRLNVPPFDQFGWRIESAAIAPAALVQPGSDQARQLLANGCK